MELMAQPTLIPFLLQTIILILPFPGSYLAYRWSKAPQKRSQAMTDMAYLGLTHAGHWEKTINEEYHLRHYVGPLFFACSLTLVTFSLTHPYVLQTGLTVGLLEEILTVFGSEAPFPTAILVGRLLFWGWIGAYVYALFLTFRRFMDYDLSPNVYIFVCNRFLLAFVVCGIVGVSFGAYSRAAGVGLDVNLATVYLVAFFIGFFPEQGVTWLTLAAQRALRQQGGIAKETSLAEIDGLSVWDQSRLKQVDIENVQNLATADIPSLVVGTPFGLNQIIDWVDQAILLLYSSESQLKALEGVSIRAASDILVVAQSGELDDLAEVSGLARGHLNILYKVLSSAFNMQIISRYRQQMSLVQVTGPEVMTLQSDPMSLQLAE